LVTSKVTIRRGRRRSGVPLYHDYDSGSIIPFFHIIGIDLDPIIPLYDYESTCEEKISAQIADWEEHFSERVWEARIQTSLLAS
jgi:hypothetical protein